VACRGGEDVGRTARTKADNEAHRPCRIGLRSRNARHGRQRSRAYGQMQKLPSVGKFHFSPSDGDEYQQRSPLPGIAEAAMSPIGTTRTSRDVRFGAAIEGTADINMPATGEVIIK